MAAPESKGKTPHLMLDTMIAQGFADEVFRKHLQDRQILINGIIDDTMIERVVMQIEAFNHEDDLKEASGMVPEAAREPIFLMIHSPGGHCDPGLSVVSAIQQSATPVVGVAVGMVGSMAFVIYAACHARHSYRHATFMIHDVAYGMNNSLEGHREYMGYIEQLNDRTIDIITSRTLITRKKLESIATSKTDWYFFAEEAVEVGLVDEIYPEALRVPKPKRRKKAK